MKVLIDNGHGEETKGKRSPDGRLIEYAYARDVASGIVRVLKLRGVEAELLVPEKNDVSLDERVRRANRYGASEAIVVSVHCDAAGDGSSWLVARGWSARVGLNASVESKRLAGMLAGEAEANGLRVRRPSPGTDYWRQDLAICRDTRCAAVLTENLFMDNRNDVEFLLSEIGRKAIVETHVKGIIKYMGAL